MQDGFSISSERLPDIKCPYEAPDVCAAGANTIVGNIMILIVMVALTVLML